MAERRTPIRKTPTDILEDLLNGHRDARISGEKSGMKYLQNFADRNDSIPNAVKFFLYDLLVEDAYQADDLATCRTAIAMAADYLPTARTELQSEFRAHAPSIHLYERGIAVAMDDGDWEQALVLCDQAIALGQGHVYAAKRATIERML